MKFFFLLAFLFCSFFISPALFASAKNAIRCHNPYVIDGDTLECAGQRIRLASIDTPEMPGHCKMGRRCINGNAYAAKKHLQKISRGDVTCQASGTDHYGRTIAACSAGEIDFSCAMVASGHAVERYGRLSCG